MNSDTIIDVRAAIAAAALYSLSVIGIVKAERTVERTGKSLHAIEKSAGPETLFAGRELFWLPRSRRAPGKFKTAETELAVQSTSDDFKPSSHWESARDKAVAKKSFHPDAPAITLGPLRPF